MRPWELKRRVTRVPSEHGVTPRRTSYFLHPCWCRSCRSPYVCVPGTAGLVYGGSHELKGEGFEFWQQVASQWSSSGSWTCSDSSEPSDPGISYAAPLSSLLKERLWPAGCTLCTGLLGVGCTDGLTLVSLKGAGISRRFLQSCMQITEPSPFLNRMATLFLGGTWDLEILSPLTFSAQPGTCPCSSPG